MEELENEYDKGIYWAIFFIGLIIIALLGYKFVFSYNKDEDVSDKDVTLEDNLDIDDYKGIWQLFGDDEIPEQELCVNIIDGSTITFDYFVRDVAYFESQTASLDENTATFTMKDRNEEITVVGKLIFKNDKVFLAVTSSSLEDIATGTIEFSSRGEESLLDK